MSVVTSIQIPTPGAPFATFQATVDLLNSVSLTSDQVERGYMEMVNASEQGNGMAALIDFAEREGLTPSAVAAHAIRVRALQYVDALSDGVDLKTECPDVYEAIMAGPIYPGDLGYFPNDPEEL